MKANNGMMLIDDFGRPAISDWGIAGNRAPEDTVMGNTHRPRGQGKCNRKQTARPDLSAPGKGETVR